MIRNYAKFATYLCASALGLSLAACSSAPEPVADEVAAEKRIGTPHQVTKPSAEELANSPCGNPDWAQLPEGAEKPAAPDAPPAGAAPGSGDTSANQAPASDEHARGASSLSQIKPCT